MVAPQVEVNRIQFGGEPWSPHRKYNLLTTSAFQTLPRPQNVLSENQLFEPDRTVDFGKPNLRVVNGEARNAHRIIFEGFDGMP
jgi:hypothetical protein